MESLECVRVLEGHNEAVLALAVGPSFLVSGSYDTTVRFWALDTLRCVRRVPDALPASVTLLRCLSLHACSSMCPGIAASQTLGLSWMRRKCEGHEDAVRVLAVASGKVFSGSYDGTIGVW